MVKWDGGPRRPARDHPAEDREIRFFFDYGVDWPLWEDNTAEYMMTPDDYGLSPELVELLRRCRALWDPVGAERPGQREEFRALCGRAVVMLRAEVHPIKVTWEE